MIKIAFADDHVMLRKGVATIISRFPNMDVVLQAGNGKELVEALAEAKELPDICIIDINMPEMNGYETAAYIKKRWPGIYILALSMYDTEMNIIKMLRSGANGYVLKDAEPQELKDALTAIYENGFYHSEVITSHMRRLLHHKPDYLDLSAKELQFLELSCSEYTYKDIAEIMELSPRTIDGYRESLFMKLNVTTRPGLVMYALRSGLVS